jgi:hypothetical protein
MNTSLSFNLDPNKAKEAGQSQRISETGAYTGHFTQARQVIAQSGSIGIEMSFESVSGQTADFLTVYVQGSDGRELAGTKMVHALMTCLKLRSLNSVSGHAEVFNPASKQREKQQATIFPDLCGKPVGLVLQVEEYNKSNGGIGESMKLVMPFDATSKQTAREVLDKLPAEDIENLLHNIKPVIKAKSSGSGHGNASDNQQSGSNGGGAAFEDDIPFAQHGRGMIV